MLSYLTIPRVGCTRRCVTPLRLSWLTTCVRPWPSWWTRVRTFLMSRYVVFCSLKLAKIQDIHLTKVEIKTSTLPQVQREVASPFLTELAINLLQSSLTSRWPWILTSDWSILVTWPEYWPLIGKYWSRDLNTGLWLVNADHVTLILFSDWRRSWVWVRLRRSCCSCILESQNTWTIPRYNYLFSI